MERFLILAAVLLFVFGVLLIFAPGVVKKISDFLNKSILSVDEKMRASHSLSGVLLLILSAVVFYFALTK